MWFNSPDFLAFLLIVLPVFYALGAWRSGKGMPRVLFLLAASYFFYMYWSPAYIFLILFSTTLDYCCGRLFLAWPKSRHKWILALSAGGNLSVLAFFKYARFAYATAYFLGGHVGLHLPPWQESWPIALPVGISFFTFQSMSYTIDVYRGTVQVETNFFRYALFVSYFPQLVAGPIEKAHNLLVQFKDLRHSRPFDVPGALHDISYGLFKKVAVADSLGALVDPVFAHPGNYSAPMVLTACIFFAFQIYCDFSGYTDIAIGVAKLFGVRLMTNFYFPYFTTNVTRFWRTWHISFSSWLKEYLYISLGGNRKGRLRTYANLMATMLLGGLWHGASWNFVLWGFLHGVYLCLHKLYLALRPPRPQPEPPRPWFLRAPALLVFGLFNFFLVTLTWIPFRCVAFGDTVTCLRQIFTWAAAPAATMGIDTGQLGLCWLLVGLLLIFDAFHRLAPQWKLEFAWADYARSAMPAMFLLLTMVFAAEQAQQFIYFQF